MLTATPADPDQTAALTASLMEIERHIDQHGWEQPPMLFALVRTAELEAAEPQLAQDSSGVALADRLSAIQQDEFDPGEDVVGGLARVAWPDPVVGCALSLVRSFLPPEAEQDVPADPVEAQEWVQNHPQRQDVRAVVGVLRDGTAQSVARLESHREDLLSGAEILPGVVLALADTFAPIEEVCDAPVDGPTGHDA